MNTVFKQMIPHILELELPKSNAPICRGPISIQKWVGVGLGVRAMRRPLLSRRSIIYFTLPSTTESEIVLHGEMWWPDDFQVV